MLSMPSVSRNKNYPINRREHDVKTLNYTLFKATIRAPCKFTKTFILSQLIDSPTYQKVISVRDFMVTAFNCALS